jgi:hypothetical protein
MTKERANTNLDNGLRPQEYLYTYQNIGEGAGWNGCFSLQQAEFSHDDGS